MKSIFVALVFGTTLLSGCSSVKLSTSGAEVKLSAAAEPHYHRIVKLTAVGYGSASSFERYTEGQKRLMAMRASKLDAYRSLAEQVYGVRVTGTSTVSAMMVQNDSFRVYIDAFVRGARVTNVIQMADGNYETTVEMDFDTSIVRDFWKHAPAHTAGHPHVSHVGGVGPGTAYGASYYYAE